MSESQTSLTLISEGADYELLGSDDGTSFALRFKPDHMIAHLLGDDATRFGADYKTTKSQFPTSEPDKILAQLWDQGGYSWLAVEEGY
jgi:hypothetical protein